VNKETIYNFFDFFSFFLQKVPQKSIGQLFYPETSQKNQRKSGKTPLSSHRDTKARQCKIFRQKKPQ
jgi:hypothetical protein